MRFIFSILLIVCSSAWAVESHRTASLDEALDSAIFNAGSAPIQTFVELETHMRFSAESPFAVMNPRQQALFLKSAVFTDHGLASFYMPAFRGLSVSEAVRILALFGWQDNISVLTNMLEIRDEKDSLILAAQPDFCEPIIIQGADGESEIYNTNSSVQCGPSPCALPLHICARRASCVQRLHYVCNICTC